MDKPGGIPPVSSAGAFVPADASRHAPRTPLAPLTQGLSGASGFAADAASAGSASHSRIQAALLHAMRGQGWAQALQGDIETLIRGASNAATLAPGQDSSAAVADLARLRADLNAFLYALFQTVRAEPGRGQQAAQPNAARAAYAAPYANLGSPYSERMALLVAETAAGHVTPELREAFARLQLHPSADGRPAAAEAGGTDTTALHELLHHMQQSLCLRSGAADPGLGLSVDTKA